MFEINNMLSSKNFVIFLLLLIALPSFSKEEYKIDSVSLSQITNGKPEFNEDGAIEVKTKTLKCIDKAPNNIKADSCNYSFVASYKKQGDIAKLVNLSEKKIYNYKKNNKKSFSSIYLSKDLFSDKKELDLLLEKLKDKNLKKMKNLDDFITLVTKKEIDIKKVIWK